MEAITLKLIEESEYTKLNVPILIEDKLSDRAFGIISGGQNHYKLGWQSDTMQPVVKSIDKTLYSVGIDLTFILFELSTGKILLKINLNYFFYDSRIFNDALYVITELEILKIDIAGLSVINTYPLPDYFNSIEYRDESLKVRCINNEVLIIQ